MNSTHSTPDFLILPPKLNLAFSAHARCPSSMVRSSLRSRLKMPQRPLDWPRSPSEARILTEVSIEPTVIRPPVGRRT